MTTANSTPIICAQVLRVKEVGRYEDPNAVYGWRLGPKTEDGFWMVTRNRQASSGSPQAWAVRVVVDPTATPIGVKHQDLEDALYGRLEKLAAEDAYLATINVVRMLEPDDLTRLRDAVLAGKTGGPADGAARKRNTIGNHSQIDQEIVEHYYRATRKYLESKAEPVPA